MPAGDGEPGRYDMIDFEEELKHFRPSIEVGDMEDVIGTEDLTDMTDLIMQLLSRRTEQQEI